MVGVHNVEMSVAEDPPELARGSEPSPPVARLDREDLDLDAVHRPERLHLIAHEHAELRSRGRRVHARHDQHPHRAPAYPGGSHDRPPAAFAKLSLGPRRIVTRTS